MIEGDESGYSAHVPELPTILVTGKSVDELTHRATEAIRLYWKSAQADVSSTVFRKEIEVELPV
jgi:predicted RNase H-like HicB family nuclease